MPLFIKSTCKIYVKNVHRSNVGKSGEYTPSHDLVVKTLDDSPEGLYTGANRETYTMAFRRFTKTGTRLENRITITKSRGIGLPTQYFRTEVMESTHAILYYDPDEQRVGLRFTSNPEEKGTFKILRSKGYGGHIAASSFFRVNNIDTNLVSGRYEWEKIPLRQVGLDEDGEMYTIKLRMRPTGEGANADDMPT